VKPLPMFPRAEDDIRSLLLIQEELEVFAQGLRDLQDRRERGRDLVILDFLDGAGGDARLLAELPEGQAQLLTELFELSPYVESEFFDHGVSLPKRYIFYYTVVNLKVRGSFGGLQPQRTRALCLE